MRYSFLACLIFLFACNTSGRDTSDKISVGSAPRITPAPTERELVRVTGSYVSFGILTYLSISCAGYEKQFADKPPISFLITDKAKLASVSHHLAALQLDKHDYGMDVRAKAVLMYNDKSVDTLCIGKFNIYYKGRVLVADKELNQLLGIKSS